ncbi:uncharacterized protein F4817DRAFT_71012 [Daldinia loculata]|uniref:uncharacterized protein n=1 Tax=Daldinia loculata TaxID=103429 RepID=UPI0020C4A450|nr:uncharacterized protein F4817DRAFT_71012 [Daldinia loculata]KAI1648325.1 hypothetical protein F4817DRAFT_71012 [Daldinia loculata]
MYSRTAVVIRPSYILGSSVIPGGCWYLMALPDACAYYLCYEHASPPLRNLGRIRSNLLKPLASQMDYYRRIRYNTIYLTIQYRSYSGTRPSSFGKACELVKALTCELTHEHGIDFTSLNRYVKATPSRSGYCRFLHARTRLTGRSRVYWDAPFPSVSPTKKKKKEQEKIVSSFMLAIPRSRHRLFKPASQ